MRYGIIDIGSNTMRAVAFEVYEDNGFHEVVNEKEFAEILSFVEDDVLTEGGVRQLCTVLKHMKRLLIETQCDEYSCFATASLRDIKNQSYVLETVEKEVGIRIRLLEGCEEAYYDYIGLQSCVSDAEAVGFDLGGGSAQVFSFDDYGIIASTSQEIGTLAMYNKHVKGLFPNSKQRAKIVKNVEKKLEGTMDFSKISHRYIYGMGGTARAVAKVHRHFIGSDGSTHGYSVTIEELEEFETAIMALGLGGIKILNRLIPERLVTFMPGLIIIKTIMRIVGANELIVVGHGVREGYLIENAIHRGRGFDEYQENGQSLCQ